jgi:hypothetical protein
MPHRKNLTKAVMSLITPHDKNGKPDFKLSNRETRKPKQEKAPVRG